MAVASMRRVTMPCLVLALALRVLVPAGLMPASGENGWYLEICPEGLAVEVMVQVFGDHHAHHHHHLHAADAQSETSAASYVQCDLSAGSLEVYLVSIDQPDQTQQLGPIKLVDATRKRPQQNLLGFRSRAPPTVVS
ncbi:MAG: hypothetical protein AAF529_07350 [Pseudomonadota bacterium]